MINREQNIDQDFSEGRLPVGLLEQRLAYFLRQVVTLKQQFSDVEYPGPLAIKIYRASMAASCVSFALKVRGYETRAEEIEYHYRSAPVDPSRL